MGKCLFRRSISIYRFNQFNIKWNNSGKKHYENISSGTDAIRRPHYTFALFALPSIHRANERVNNFKRKSELKRYAESKLCAISIALPAERIFGWYLGKACTDQKKMIHTGVQTHQNAEPFSVDLSRECCRCVHYGDIVIIIIYIFCSAGTHI